MISVDLLSDSFRTDPYPTYAMLREQSPVHFYEPLKYWLISRYHDVYEALRSPQYHSSRMWALFEGIDSEVVRQLPALTHLLKSQLLLSSGEEHARIRALVSHAFTPRQMEQLRPAIQHEVSSLIEGLRDRDEIDFIRDFADPLPSRLISRVLGLPSTHYELFKSWTDDIYAFVGISRGDRTVLARAANRAAEEVSNYLKREIAIRRRQPGNDLLSVLVHAEETGQQLSEDEIVSNVVGLLNAGHETTTNLLGNGLYLLLQHPEQMQDVRSNPGLIPAMLEEVARFESPVQIVARRTSSAIRIDEFEIPTDANVLLVLGAANRDPNVFPSASTFDLHRNGPRHVSYGFGPHYCIGAALARLIGTEALSAILKQWPTIQFADDISWRPYPIFRGLVTLNIRASR